MDGALATTTSIAPDPPAQPPITPERAAELRTLYEQRRRFYTDQWRAHDALYNGWSLLLS